MGANTSLPDRSQSGSRSALARLYTGYGVPDTEVAMREKKKKASKFATLRKKLIRMRRHSRSQDYAKALREMISAWSVRDVAGLVQEYEAAAALKELHVAANFARPTARTLRQDLSTLYDCKFCTDVDLIYKGTCFPAHRAILASRSPFFRNLLSRYPEFGAQVPIKLKTPGVDLPLFSALLHYLYTDELNTKDLHLENGEILARLASEFGVPNALEHDLKTLLDSGDYSDALLVFSNEDHSDGLSASQGEGTAQATRTSKYEFPCHKAILAARSPFFRNLINRRAKSGEEATERALRAPSRIVLDESVIPRRYARVILGALYHDVVDMSSVMRGSTSMCSLSEIQAMVSTGKCHMTVVDEAMEVYQIGLFLDFQVLSQGCEDVMVDNLCVENVVSMRGWGREAHGSQWVARQAHHYLTEEFLQVAHSSVLHDLSKDYLKDILSSDFLQAGEVEVLSAVLKWGEHQLVRRIEEREPNLLTHTAHSVAKKGVKKRDLNDVELREIISDLLPLVRLDHVIPSNSDILSSAIKRGLISTPPSHMLGDDTPGQRIGAWTRMRNCGVFQKPRLFVPYYEEAKAVLEDMVVSAAQEQDTSGVRMLHMSAIPDTLYMVDEQHCSSAPYAVSPVSTVDIIAGTIPVPDRGTFLLMVQREQELEQSAVAQRSFALTCTDRRAARHQLQLRVVREVGLPDTATEVLQNAHFYYPASSSSSAQGSHPHLHPAMQHHPPALPHPHHPRLAQPLNLHSFASSSSSSHITQRSRSRVSCSGSISGGSGNGSVHSNISRDRSSSSVCGLGGGGRGGAGVDHGGGCGGVGAAPLATMQLDLMYHTSPSHRAKMSPTTASPTSSYSPLETETGSDGVMSDIMPDIAMATPSLGQLSLNDELQLDIGDGGSHGSHGSRGSSRQNTLYI
ncbi:BTB/POZ domain-containing protein 7-like [Littorina saxatilis]|uniref:BTB domain-containing protein n=1 Tax=Littorina saxatilis TaxID=31220 RepID=A0AAN9BFL0_9CAEN